MTRFLGYLDDVVYRKAFWLFREEMTIEKAAEILEMSERRLGDWFRRFRESIYSRSMVEFRPLEGIVQFGVYRLSELRKNKTNKRIRLCANRPELLVAIDIKGYVFTTLIYTSTKESIKRIIDIITTKNSEIINTNESVEKNIIIDTIDEYGYYGVEKIITPNDFKNYLARKIGKRKGVNKKNLLFHVKEIETRFNDKKRYYNVSPWIDVEMFPKSARIPLYPIFRGKHNWALIPNYYTKLAIKITYRNCFSYKFYKKE